MAYLKSVRSAAISGGALKSRGKAVPKTDAVLIIMHIYDFHTRDLQSRGWLPVELDHMLSRKSQIRFGSELHRNNTKLWSLDSVSIGGLGNTTRLDGSSHLAIPVIL